MLFGLEVCLPIREHQNRPHGSEAGDDEAVALVRLVDTDALSASPVTIQPLFLSFPAQAAVPVELPDSLHGRDTGSSIPVCDSARRERSGVQLI